MEFFRTVSRPHSVDLYHDKAQLRQSGIYRRYGERFRDKRIVWSGIDILDYGIFFGRVEIYRTDDNSPNIGFSVSSFSTKHFRHSPPFCQHFADIGLFQRQQDRSVFRTTQSSYRRTIDPGPAICKIGIIPGKFHLMVSIFRCQAEQFSILYIQPVYFLEIGIFTGIFSASYQINHPGGIVHMQHPFHYPFPFGQLSFHLTVIRIIEIKMAPSVTLRNPEDLVPVFQIVAIQQIIINKSRHLLPDQHLSLRVVPGDFINYIFLMSPFVIIESKRTTVIGPTDIVQAKLFFRFGKLDIYLSSFLHQKQYRSFDRQGISRFHIIDLFHFGLQLSGRRRHDGLQFPDPGGAVFTTHQFPGIRRPADKRRIVFSGGSVVAQPVPLAATYITDKQISFTDKGFFFSIGRRSSSLPILFIHTSPVAFPAAGFFFHLTDHLIFIPVVSIFHAFGHKSQLFQIVRKHNLPERHFPGFHFSSQFSRQCFSHSFLIESRLFLSFTGIHQYKISTCRSLDRIPAKMCISDPAGSDIPSKISGLILLPEPICFGIFFFQLLCTNGTTEHQ